MEDAYSRLIALLDEGGAEYRLIDHEPEGRTEIVSAMRGHDPAAAAKCMVVMIKIGKKVTRYVVAVVAGNARVDLQAIKSLFAATYVSFASPAAAEQISGSGIGTILPFIRRPDVELLVDPAVLERQEMFFNAGRLDRSIALKTNDYARLAHPRIVRIADEA